jgi:hypothetical protein
MGWSQASAASPKTKTVRAFPATGLTDTSRTKRKAAYGTRQWVRQPGFTQMVQKSGPFHEMQLGRLQLRECQRPRSGGGSSAGN